VKLARGADVLVHSVMYPPAVPRLVARVPNAAVLEKSVLAHQTSAEDAGRIAQEAGVKTLVLSHFVPPDDPEVTEAMWLEARRNVISGERSSSAEISLRSNLAADDQNTPPALSPHHGLLGSDARTPSVFQYLSRDAHDLLAAFARTNLTGRLGQSLFSFRLRCIRNLVLQLFHGVVELVLLLEANQVPVWSASLVLVVRHAPIIRSHSIVVIDIGASARGAGSGC
jgi:hypothetical protein